MIVGFLIWTAMALIPAAVGAAALKSGKAAGFFSGIEPPEVTDVKKYNRSVATLWFVYAVLLELLGLPLLFLKQNAAGFLGMALGVPVISIGLVVAYQGILRRYERKN